jgi:hypothetical protein
MQFFYQELTMKAFCFLNDDDLSQLPADVRLIPLDVAYLEALSETPRTLTAEKSPRVRSASAPAKPGLNNPNPVD